MSKLYEQSGVSLSEANKLNESLKKKLNISAFAGISQGALPQGIEIVTCCDGIGSKIIPLYEKKRYKTIAIDLIAANLNDMACSGATAIGFLDYIAVNKLDSEAVSGIIEELKMGLEKFGCKLMGGETSEISELIKEGKIDVSGFAIGVLQPQHKLSCSNIKEGDVIIGLCSSGIHANGFSLIRKFHSEGKLNDEEFETCLKESFVYYNEVSRLTRGGKIKACANITGGGIESNLNRAIPDGFKAKMDFSAIPAQKIFEKLKTLCQEELYEVFNAGVGFCIIADKKYEAEIFETCKTFSPFILGKIERSQNA